MGKKKRPKALWLHTRKPAIWDFFYLVYAFYAIRMEITFKLFEGVFFIECPNLCAIITE